jgi:hypothetical protein
MLDTPDTVSPMSRGTRIALLAATAIVVASVAGACLPPARSTTSGPTAAPSPAGGGGSARPSPSQRAFVKAIEAFTERVSAGKLSYHVAFKGSVRASVNLLPITGAMDVSGGDFASSFTYDFSHDYVGMGKIRVQVRAVRSKGYMKSGAAAWRTIKDFGERQSYVLFQTVKAADDVKYLGAVTSGGKTYHKIGVTGALLIHPNTLPGMSQKEAVDDTELEVVIDDVGRPRSGTWRLWGKSRVGENSGQLQRIVYELDLTFSKVGSKISIKRP